MVTVTRDKLEMALKPAICFTGMNDAPWRQVNFNSSIFFVLRVPSIWRSLGKWKILSFFFGRSIVRLSTLFLQSLIISVEYLASCAMSLWVFECSEFWPDDGIILGLYQIQKGFKSLRVEATGKFWIMDPYFNNADLIQQNLTNKGIKLGVGYISINGQKLTVFLFPLAVAGMCRFGGPGKIFVFFRLWSTRICPLSAE